MKKIPYILNLKLVNSYFPFQMEEIKSPQQLKAKLTGGGLGFSVVLTWEYDLNTPPVKFNIYVKNGSRNEPGEFEKTFTIYDKKYIANYISSGKKYCYYVTAVTLKGESQPSKVVEVTIADPSAGSELMETTLQNNYWQASGEKKGPAIVAAAIDRGDFGQYKAAAYAKGFFRVAKKIKDYDFNSPKEDYGEKTISESC